MTALTNIIGAATIVVGSEQATLSSALASAVKPL
jgi:hypothetical protein